MSASLMKNLSWVKRGKQRREIIVHLSGTKTPSEIARDSGYSLNHTSRVLGEFKKGGLVTLLNPKEKTGRLYRLTDQGREVCDAIRK